jgi:hypothetical protein
MELFFDPYESHGFFKSVGGLPIETDAVEIKEGGYKGGAHRVGFPGHLSAKVIAHRIPDPPDEIATDKYGRVKVKFFWDREGQQDPNSSCWIRVGTIWGGKGSGFDQKRSFSHKYAIFGHSVTADPTPPPDGDGLPDAWESAQTSRGWGIDLDCGGVLTGSDTAFDLNPTSPPDIYLRYVLPIPKRPPPKPCIWCVPEDDGTPSGNPTNDVNDVNF